MKDKEKTKYSIWQNVRYMVKLAWSHHKSVVWMCFLWAGLSLGIAVVQLFIAPMVLEKVEAAAPLGELLGTIGIFAAALVVLSGILGYVEENRAHADYTQLSYYFICATQDATLQPHLTQAEAAHGVTAAWMTLEELWQAVSSPIFQRPQGKFLQARDMAALRTYMALSTPPHAP